MTRLKLVLTAVLVALCTLNPMPASAGSRVRVPTSPTRGSASPLISPTNLSTPSVWQSPGGRYPDKTDPTRFLAPPLQRTFQCIRFHESRNHLNDGSASQGWYQLTFQIWNFAATQLGLPLWTGSWSPNRATGDQQSAVAVFYLERNGRFGVEWAAEAGECPGRF
jgi:hypothetical protein